ncbi:UDP-2,3-diacylglucosamine diphosphatase [Sulfuriroseicoccus oceanibius]|uniref:UDP-2,3-diacylglucosamine diphosphatase n=1 Tax=Sulfuriroseicoccus oceanibius TaxID=2707525 RepID=A0A6B3L1Y1_9BACT|nr:UDP-2,3-diacylglucosamine diphosphatase [Sulfuriroseicoccus oceanibius]QQL45541.1 UDP-2,3-diacylglucosamine diphosphatase [Sulfuriroseicoccus oceanibius]
MKKTRLRFKTVIISDVHLGTPDSKVRQVTRFIRHISCERLILNGDIVDGWYLRRHSGGWTDEHTRFVRHLLKLAEKQDTEVIYLRGNHDEVIEPFLPLTFGSLKMRFEYRHHTPQGDYLVVHGDGFDHVTTGYKWVAGLGSVGYEALLKFNRGYNQVRSWFGKDYYSVSKAIKARVKNAVSFFGRYEEQLQMLAERRGCVGIICGHIHTPEDKQVGGVHYLNSGDWVESMTAIVENEPGEFEVIDYKEFNRRLDDKAWQMALEYEQEKSHDGPGLRVVDERMAE